MAKTGNQGITQTWHKIKQCHVVNLFFVGNVFVFPTSYSTIEAFYVKLSSTVYNAVVYLGNMLRYRYLRIKHEYLDDPIRL